MISFIQFHESMDFRATEKGEEVLVFETAPVTPDFIDQKMTVRIPGDENERNALQFTYLPDPIVRASELRDVTVG